MAIDFNSGVNLFHPNFKTPFARSFSVGFQRTISRQMAIEVRYVGTRLVDGTATENWNEVNWTTNGFLDEFKLAQANLQANLASGVAGARELVRLLRTGDRDVPAADLPGELQRPRRRASQVTQSLYTGANWTNTARLAELRPAKSEPGRRGEHALHHAQRSARTWRRPGIRATSSSSIRTSATPTSRRTANTTKYDSLQINLRRALSGGLAVDANYTFAKRYGSTLDTLRAPRHARAVDATACRTRSRRP